MIEFEEFTLSNGLRVIVNTAKDTPMVAFNLLYNVGAKDEDEGRTGFAHLFEHLMFGGSVNIPSFDTPLQEVGGENNAFTSNDLTNYYITLPKISLETAFWLESDRMLSLSFSEKSLEVQRQVVIEEYKQRYLNQPYGDVYLLLRPLAYKKHPYRWATIGKDIAHIQEATMDDVKAFFKRFYRPNNAILSISGDVTLDEIKNLAEKWFGEIPSGPTIERKLPQEETQKEARQLTVERDVPLDAIYIAYHMVDRLHPDYYTSDLISDILSRGNSSRFYQALVKQKQLFIEIDAYITGDIDQGLFIVAGKVAPGIDLKIAEEAVLFELQKIQEERMDLEELEKVKNKVFSSNEFAKISALNRAMSLAIATLIDSPDLVNEELKTYFKVEPEDVQRVSRNIFRRENSSTLYYKSKQKKA
jgi:predicted Zn-dependent peptidase